ncbi:MAG: Crp/Fnr family transcriptional regulator [Polyangiales bacterium]
MLTPIAAPARLPKLIAASRLFTGVDPKIIADLAASSTTRKLTRAEHLWRAGDPATHFHLVQTGIFKIMRSAADGSEAIVGLFGPRESIGDVAVMGSRKYPAAAVVATETAEVIRIPAEPILASMTVRPDVAGALNRSLVEHTQALQEKIRVMSAGSVPKRLATLLLYLGERFGDEGEDGRLFIPLALNRSELACLIGARVETTIRTVRRWEKEGIVATQDDGFRIEDMTALVAKTRSTDDND